MARPRTFEKSHMMNTRMDDPMYVMLKEIASLESTYSGRRVSVQDLVRNAITFCYEDGERLREVFRRSRKYAERLYKKYRNA